MGICGKKREIYETTSGSHLFLAIFLLEHCWWGWRGMTPMLPSRMCYWAVLYMLPVTHIFTARQRNVEGYVFISVCHSVHGGGSHVTITHDALHLTVQSHPSQHSPGPSPLGPPPPCLAHGTLTCGGHHWSMYGWQADSKHPTGMLSCLLYVKGQVYPLAVFFTVVIFCCVVFVQSHTKRKIIHCR